MPKVTHSELKRTDVSVQRKTTGDWFGLAVKSILALQGIVWLSFNFSDYLPPSSELRLKSYYEHAAGSCRPPLPQLGGAVSPTDPIFRKPSGSLDRFLKARTAQSDIDSLAVAVVTPSGVVFQRGYGVLKANETDPEKLGKVDENSIYRIGSITKMFNVLETLILRDRAVLNWDDPVTKFLPNFTYNPQNWPKYLSNRHNSSLKVNRQPITIRQLASHMSGIGRDYHNLSDIGKWPPPLLPGGSMGVLALPTINTLGVGDGQTPTRQEILQELQDLPLILPPYTYPIYSNLGFNVLGWVNVEANAASGNRIQEPDNFPDLLRRDIFDRVGMNSSTFTTSDPHIANRVAVAKKNNEATFLDLTDAYNPAGGQYSSLSDMSVFMQTLLDPHRENSVLGAYTVREWLRPLHPWSDDISEVGAPWEIFKTPDSFGRIQRSYHKGGNIGTHQANFAISPSSSYGVIILIAGQYTDAARLAHEAMRRFQPVFDELQQRAAKDAYVGRWSASEGGERNRVTIATRAGSLWVDEYILNGTDVMALFQARKPGKAKPSAMWNTGPDRTDEFRIAVVPGSSLIDDPLAGCGPSWLSIDGINTRGVPLDLVYFEQTGENGERILKIPSARIVLTRVPHHK